MDEKITTDIIINYLQNQVEQKLPIDPGTFLDAAEKLNILLGDEHEELFSLAQKCAIIKADKILEGKSVAMAKALLEASDDYRHMLSQKAKIERIVEFIRLAKLHARIKNDEIKGY